MTTTLTAIVGALQQSLSDQSLCWVEEWDEVGMAPVTRITEQGPQQDGDTDIDFRLGPRIFSLLLGTLGVGATDALALVDLYNRQAQILSLFKPRQSPIKLMWVFDDGSARQIDCHFYDKMSFGIPDRLGLYQQIPVLLRAADPLFYDPAGQATTYSLGGGGTGFAVPSPVPTSVGASTIDQTRQIIYAGQYLEHPIIIIVGPITDCVITNNTTGEKLDFTGYTIAGGTQLTIDTRYGHKTVIDQAGANQIAHLTDDSDLATFHLETDPDAAGGSNDVRVTGSSVTSASEIYLEYYNRYIGLS